MNTAIIAAAGSGSRMVSARPKDLVDHYWVRLTLIAWVVIAAWFLHDRWAQMHFLSLPDSTILRSGHGPESTIGIERLTNPFLTGAYEME